MSRVLMAFWIILVILVLAAGYVRLAPTDAAKWHRPLTFEQDRRLPGGTQRVIEAGPDTLSKLDALIMAHPRTKTIAGSVQDGHITYESRTKVIQFPDYITVQQVGDRLKIYSRLRFGRRDMGVNHQRLSAWLNALQAGG
ncbi:MAG: DUF1499 domain-containing protein [Arenibacterium sp.]